MSLLSALLLVAPAAAVAPPLPPPTLLVRAEGSVGAGEPTPAGALAAAAGVPLSGGVDAELEALVGVDGAPAPRLGGLAGVRVYLGGAFSVSALAGGGWRPDGPVPLGRAGVAYDYPVSRARLRLSLLGEVTPSGLAGVLGVGMAFPLEERAPEPVAEAHVHEEDEEIPEPPEPPATGDIEVNVPNALVWVPHPVCAWVPASEAAALLSLADPTLPVQVRAPGYLPGEVPREGSRTVILKPAPTFGAVVVVAYPGDRVSIAEAVFPLAADGTAVFGAPEGPLAVTVSGAGRTAELEGAVAAGYALWLRAPEPQPLVVSFDPGSASLSTASLGAVELYAKQAGTYTFRVVGSFAPDGDAPETRRVADARAEALKSALLAAGVSAKSISVLGTVAPADGATPDALRTARIEPILPKDDR